MKCGGGGGGGVGGWGNAVPYPIVRCVLAIFYFLITIFDQLCILSRVLNGLG